MPPGTQRAACVSRWKQAALVPLESAYDFHTA